MDPGRAWAFSGVSSAVGLMLSIPMATAESPHWAPFLLLGVAHGIVFIPSVCTVQHPAWFRAALSLLCVAFPYWGTVIGMLTVGILAPLGCSIFWGLVLAAAMRRFFPVIMLSCVGLLTNLSMFLKLGSQEPDVINLWWFIPVWYILMFPAMAFILTTPKLTVSISVKPSESPG